MRAGDPRATPVPSPPATDAPGVPDRADLLAALALLVAAALAFGLGFQERTTGDGALLATRYALGVGRDYPHVLYLPACDLLGRLPLSDPIGAPKLLSVLGGAIGVAAAYLLARGFGAGRAAALFGTLLLALSPVLQFFATTIEVHAFHLGAVGLAACATLYAPWRRPAAALALTAAVLPLAFLSHRAGAVLGLGWLLLVRRARERVAPPFPWRTTLLVHGPLLLAVTLAGILAANWLTAGELALQTEAQRSFVESFHRPPAAHRMLLDGWLLPLALLLPAAVVGFVRAGPGPGPRIGRWVAPAMIAPGMAFFFWWGVAERGGYFLGTAPFLAVLAARALPVRPAEARPALAALAVLLVLAQGALGRREVAAFGTGFANADRVAQADRALDGEGVLVSFRLTAPRIEIFHERIREFPTDEEFRRVLSEGVPVEEFVATALANLRGLLGLGEHVALDLVHERMPDDPVLRPRRPYVEALVEAAGRELRAERFEHESWPMLRLRAP